MTAQTAQTAQAAQARLSSPAPVASVDEAAELITHYKEVMDTLLQIIEEETELVRAGKLREAMKLNGDKGELARLYLADTTRLQASTDFLAQVLPELLEGLRARHATFRSLLQINLTVLATAHAVAEGIVRGVSNDITRKSRPQTYGATGLQNAPPPRSSAPLSVCRTL